MKSKTKPILKVLHIISWIIFIGLCVRTGAILYSFFVSLFINSEGAKNLYGGLNLSSLFNYDRAQYCFVVSLIAFISALKAYVFYLVIKIFLKINFVHPFSETVTAFISRIGYVALFIGILSIIGNSYCDWLGKKGVEFPDLNHFMGAGVEHLLFAGVIVFISQVFKRGIEIQSENELTV
ncbi:MAG TPA: DUF2975 domain-containing protein [Chitinophagaceae bacterium]|nr:DUF2975 domain-containing protein [Chitinophagaceae bacterium]